MLATVGSYSLKPAYEIKLEDILGVYYRLEYLLIVLMPLSS